MKCHLAAAVVIVLTLGMFLPIPSAEAKVTVHSVTVTTDKSSYTIGSETIATAVLDYTGSKKDLQPVNFTWHYPNGTIAKSDSNVAPDGTGTAYSAFTTDFVGNGHTVKATYTGDESKFDETTFDVVPAPPSNMVSGKITVDTIWTLTGSPYIVLDNVSVEDGVTLTIEPGVVVEFKDLTSLTVNGTLVAVGNQTNMITFTSNNSSPQPGDWNWINFNEAENDSTISYSRIEYSKYGINIYQCSPEVTYNLIRDVLRDGIRAYKSASFIGYNTITEIVHTYVGNKGINLLGFCNTTIQGNVITHVEEYGIKVTDSNPIITQNYISGSYYNIDCYRSNATISDNMLYDAEIAGIRLRECSDATITNNTIQGSARKGIESDWSSPTISDNLILENGGTGLDDSGIYLYKSEDAAIVNNYLEDNKYGIYLKNSNTSRISGNEVINSTEDGFYADNSHEIELENNIFDGNEIGIYISDSVNISLERDRIENSADKGMYLYNSTGIAIGQGQVAGCASGMYIHSSSAIISNSTLSDITGSDFYLTQESYLTSINSSFDEEGIQVLGGSQLIVKNYLHIFVENESYLPFQDATIEILDGSATAYSTQTDDEGFCRFLLLTDRIYAGSSTATENVTTVEVEGGDTDLENNPREVDMAYSHLEIFGSGNPLSLEITYPANQSLIFDTVNITGAASSQDAQIISVDVKVDKGGWFQAVQTNGGWSAWSFELNTNSLSDGWHKVFARTSTTYHERETYIEVLVDNIGNKPPVVIVTSHANYDEVNGTIIIEGTSFDYDGDVRTVVVRIDEGNSVEARPFEVYNWSQWSRTIDTTGYPNGEHNITVSARDNSFETTTIVLVLIFNNEVSDNGDGGEDGDEDFMGSDSFLWIILAIIVIIALLVVMFSLKRRKKDVEDEGEFE